MVNREQFTIFTLKKQQIYRTFAAVKTKAFLGLILCIVVTFSGCKNGSTPHREKPADLISEDSIVEMMAEQQIIESFIAQNPQEDQLKTMAEEAYSNFFRKHNVTPQRYESSVKYYLREQEDAERVLNKTCDRLTEMRNAMAAE
ncbi:MAG: DUF4296 domain-containing protein [Bacteroidales bacterium]|nr:DUF4296 domain-containing protein [Bacteroidales bacterium]